MAGQTLGFRIGNYAIRIRQAKPFPIHYWPQWMFEPFKSSPALRPDIALDLEVSSQKIPLLNLPPVYDSNSGYWRLVKTGDGFIVDVPDTRDRNKIYARAHLSRDFSRAHVQVQPTRQKDVTGWAPAKIFNPLVEICILTRLGREGGALLHASGVKVGKEAWIFTGPSGAGKTTLSAAFVESGYTALSDERILLRRSKGKPFAYGTPWPGEGHLVSNQSAPLAAVFFIRHGSGSHSLHKVSTAQISGLFLKQCFLPLWDRDAMEGTVRFLKSLHGKIRFYDFAPLKSLDAVDFIVAAGKRRALRPALAAGKS